MRGKKRPPETDEGHRKVATIDYSVPTPKGGEAWHQMDVHINDGFVAAVQAAMQPMIEEERRKAEAAMKLLRNVLEEVRVISWSNETGRTLLTIDGKDRRLADYSIIATEKAQELTGRFKALHELMNPPQKDEDNGN